MCETIVIPPFLADFTIEASPVANRSNQEVAQAAISTHCDFIKLPLVWLKTAFYLTQ